MNHYGKLKPKIKAAWLKALRSGNFRQTQNILCQIGDKNKHCRYCCLGVLGRVVQKMGLFDVTFAKPISGPFTNNPSARNLVYGEAAEDAALPDDLQKELGITDAGSNHLVSMNDDEGKNFKEIADWIETHL